MTLLYSFKTWNTGMQEAQPQIPENIINLWKHVTKKSNWRIVELPNGFYQTEHRELDNEDTWVDVTRRETIEGAEKAIDSSIDHYKKKLMVIEGPKVVKTFK